MNCDLARENLIELAEGKTNAAADHVRSCPNCASQLQSLKSTMALLDEWKAPEPSPYFDQRLQALLREERDKAPVGFFAWLRKPALAVAFAVLMAAGVVLFNSGKGSHPVVTARSTSAVADLQSLDQNEDMYANFDALDDLPNRDSGQVEQ
jgi:anti-sigma factor RsiW